HQEEAFKAAGVDRYRAAIGDIVDRKSVEGGAIVSRRECRRCRSQRFEIMGTEDAPDLLGGLIDACGGHAAKTRKPFSTARHQLEAGFCNDRLGHVSTAASSQLF